MNRISKFLGSAGVFALSALAAQPALAAGTASGTTITNTVTVNYQVGGVAQTATSASNTVTVVGVPSRSPADSLHSVSKSWE